MPDPKKKPFMQLSPRQQVLDADARKTGKNLADYRDGESYEALKDAKGAVGHVESKDLSILKEGMSPWIGKQANSDEVPRYREKMEAEYDSVKNRDRRRAGQPTGYDAAMRGVVRPRLATTPMFQKKK
jgi:hypothetical protein